MNTAEGRVFLLLQGPHGPFFAQLADILSEAGARVVRVAFNAGDAWFCGKRVVRIDHLGPVEDWPTHLDAIIAREGVTDIVLYGDVRPIHAAARAAATQYQLRLHVFEEGYLRPFWVTYERGGSNGHSRLMSITVEEMQAALKGAEGEMGRPPALWGDMRQHKFYGALYHFFVAVANQRYKAYRSHRNISVLREFRLNFRNLILTPVHALMRGLQAQRIRRSGHPFSLVLMQLEHDSNFRAHAPYETMSDFTDEILEAFAHAAPRHHHLVFKAHPLEDDRAGIRAAITRKSEALGLSKRVHFVRGGKLAPLLSQARSVLTVNSTAAQQALWRGLPVLARGRAVFSKPGLVANQNIEDFFAQPERPDPKRYRIYRDYLLETSQVPGGFYAARSRAHALRQVVDMILSPLDPYDALAEGQSALRQLMERGNG